MAQPDPAAAVKQLATEIKEKFDEAGMGAVEEFMDQMDDIVDKAKEGSGAVIKAAREQVEGIQKKIEEALADPKSLVPGGGLAACAASCYTKSVQTKLRAFGDDSSALVETLTKLAGDVQKPLKDLAEGLERAMSQLEGSVKALAKLPKLIARELEGKDSPDDIGKIDTAPMKKALAKSDLDGPLGALGGMKDMVGSAIEALKAGVEALEGFLTSAPDTVRRAFDMPGPLSLIQGVLMSKAPQLMTDLLAMVETLKGFSLKPVLVGLSSTQGSLGGLSAAQDTLKNPVEKFTDSAAGLVDQLDATVTAARMAGGAAGVMGAVAKMFG